MKGLFVQTLILNYSFSAEGFRQRLISACGSGRGLDYFWFLFLFNTLRPYFKLGSVLTYNICSCYDCIYEMEVNRAYISKYTEERNFINYIFQFLYWRMLVLELYFPKRLWKWSPSNCDALNLFPRTLVLVICRLLCFEHFESLNSFSWVSARTHWNF